MSGPLSRRRIKPNRTQHRLSLVGQKVVQTRNPTHNRQRRRSLLNLHVSSHSVHTSIFQSHGCSDRCPGLQLIVAQAKDLAPLQPSQPQSTPGLHAPFQPLVRPETHQQSKGLHPLHQVSNHSSKAETPLKLPHLACFHWSLGSPQQAAKCFHAQQQRLGSSPEELCEVDMIVRRRLSIVPMISDDPQGNPQDHRRGQKASTLFNAHTSKCLGLLCTH